MGAGYDDQVRLVLRMHGFLLAGENDFGVWDVNLAMSAG